MLSGLNPHSLLWYGQKLGLLCNHDSPKFIAD